MKKFLCFIAGAVFALSATALATSTTFTDEDSFDEWYEEAVFNVYDQGIITGYEDGSFGATNNVNRAELAVMMDRFLDTLRNACIYDDQIYLEGDWKDDYCECYHSRMYCYGDDGDDEEDSDGGTE